MSRLIDSLLEDKKFYITDIFQASTLAVEADVKPKVIMTNRTHNAVILSFDPFSPSPDYSHGYVASWRRLGDLAWKMGGQETQNTVMSQDSLFI